MRCLVTGGAGFIGSHVVDTLIGNNHEVIVLDNLSTGSIKNINPIAQFVNGDIRYYNKIHEKFKNIDWVFHLAALPRIKPSFDDPISHHKVNVLGTLNCLHASYINNVKKFIYSGSSSCYSIHVDLPTKENYSIGPISPYALQKYQGELYCKLYYEQYGLKTVVLRYFNVYGLRSYNPKNPMSAYTSVVGLFLEMKKKNQKLTITGDGEQRRDFINVKDVAWANMLAADTELNSFETFNIGYGKNHSINEVADIISQDRIYIPKRKGEVKKNLADITRAKSILGWTPRLNLTEGISQYSLMT